MTLPKHKFLKIENEERKTNSMYTNYKNKQDVFVKHECSWRGHFLRNVIFIFDLDLCR